MSARESGYYWGKTFGGPWYLLEWSATSGKFFCPGVSASFVECEFSEIDETPIKRVSDSKILQGAPKTAEELLPMLERRLGSMKLSGERDDLLLDVAVFILRASKLEL